MQAVEPVLIEYDGNGISPGEEETSKIENWEYTKDLLFNKAASEVSKNELSTEALLQEYYEVIESNIEPIFNVAPSKVPDLRMKIRRQRGRRSNSTTVMYTTHDGETAIIPDRRFDGRVIVVSNNNEKARAIRDDLTEEINNLENAYRRAGVQNIRVYTGSDYTIRVLEHNTRPDAQVKSEEPNDFEQEILNNLEPTSEAFANNVKVNFEGHSACPEYDILFPSIGTSPSGMIYIEAKDYSAKEEEPDSTDVIDKPIKKSGLINISSTYVCIKGIDEKKLNDYKKQTELRNRLNILKSNEYKKEIENVLENMAARQFSSVADGLTPV